jgi:hypothetical protein
VVQLDLNHKGAAPDPRGEDDEEDSMVTSNLRRDVSQHPDWPAVLAQSRTIIDTYFTLVTLRQLFYRLVAAQLLPNTANAYKALSRHTAEARRAGTFPALMDRGRTIHRYQTFASPKQARHWIQQIYRRDRTEGQQYSVYLGVEKAGIVEQLREWFGALGVPILALGGYGSQTYVDDVVADVDDGRRPAVLLYAGDFDPSGEDIDRDFIKRTNCWHEVRRVALTDAQVKEYDLPPQMGKDTDSRAQGFIARHGRLVQVELDALPPDILRAFYADALADFWNDNVHDRAVSLEATERRTLEG